MPSRRPKEPATHPSQVWLWRVSTIAVVVGGLWTLFVYLYPPPPPPPKPVPPPQVEEEKKETQAKEPPVSPRLRVRTVSYGYGPSKWCKDERVTAKIKAMCDDLAECPPFKVQNYLCPDGDPAPQERKQITIAYDCSGQGMQPAVALDDESVHLKCN